MSFGNETFKPLHIRDNFLFLKGNVKNFATKGGETGVNEVVAGNSNPGSWPDPPCVIGIYHERGEAAQPGLLRDIDVEVLFDFGGTTDITANQYVAGIRSAINIGSATTLGSGSANEYVYGIQGKVVQQGTINLSAGFCAALFGQYDTSGASAAITSGYAGPLILDFGATSHLSSSAYLNGITMLNTTACQIHSAFLVNIKAAYYADITDATGNTFTVGTTAATAAGTLKVLVNGATRYIQLYSSES